MDRLLALSLFSLLGTLITSKSPVLPWGGGVLLFFALLLVRRKWKAGEIRSAACWALVAALFGFLSATRGRSSLDHFGRARAQITRANALCFGTGSVMLPVAVRRERYILRVHIDRPTCDEVPLADPLTIELSVSEEEYRGKPFFWGDRVAVLGQVSPIEIMDNPELTWREPSVAVRGVHARGTLLWIDPSEDMTRRPTNLSSLLSHLFKGPIDRFRLHARDLLARWLPARDRDIARALVLGENELQAEDERAFRWSGLSHLLAVSGMHLVLVVGVFERLLRSLTVVFIFTPRLLLRRDRLVLSALLLFVWAYCFFAGASGSAVRASWMYTFVALANAQFLRLGAPKALGLSILTMLLLEPLAIHDPSFALSVSATLGLVLFRAEAEASPFSSPRTRFDRWMRSGIAKAVKDNLRTSLATALCTAPVLLAYGNGVAVFGILANVVAIPIGESCALPLSLLLVLASLASPIQAVMGPPLASALVGALAILRKVATFASLFPLLSSGGVATTLRRLDFFGPPSALRLTLLDVGQGDALLLDLPDGTAALIDGGGLVGTTFDVGESIVGPVLRARGIDSLALMVLSHPHPDHYLGLRHVVNNFNVRSFWAPDVVVPPPVEKMGDHSHSHGAMRPPSYQAFVDATRARGIKMEIPPCHAPRWIGGAIWTVLAPCPKPEHEENANNHSLVVRVAWGKTCFLLTGDAEREEEARTLETSRDRGELHCDVLKVGHHGSRTSTTHAWIDAVRPSIAAISAGRHNRFGHPHGATLDALRLAGVRVLQTDLHGQIRITSDGSNITVEDAPSRWFWAEHPSFPDKEPIFGFVSTR